VPGGKQGVYKKMAWQLRYGCDGEVRGLHGAIRNAYAGKKAEVMLSPPTMHR
jgi:hypothetical protein